MAPSYPLFMFSKACEYGIRAAIYVADRSGQGKRAGQKEIAMAIASPEAFTAKILQQLVRHRIIESAKGPNGGFFIDPGRKCEISLGEIVTAIDGQDLFVRCGLGLRDCNAEKPCPLHGKFVSIRIALKEMLESTKIEELTKGLRQEQTWLKL